MRSASCYMVLLAMGVPTANAQTVYVDEDATGPTHDGTSWCDAYMDLQDALVGATAGTTIRVADGTYTPDQGGGQTSGDRSATFQLVNGVVLEGGYAGCAAGDPDERDLVLYETILTGDLDGDDGADFANNDENVYTVVTGSNIGPATVLDGLIVTAGNAHGLCCNDGRTRGGGMYLFLANPTIRECTFLRNTAFFGGAIYATGELLGGGSSPTLIDCIFLENAAGFDAGGYANYSNGSSPSFVNCMFVGNTGGAGGGMYTRNTNTPSLVNCLFTGNAATQGAGLYDDSGNTYLSLCTFGGNSASQDGGGLYQRLGGSTLENCILWGNTDAGGADEAAQLFFVNSPPTVNYSLVQGLTGALGGEGNIGDDPLFIDGDGPDNLVGTQDDNLRLGVCSRAIDAARNFFVPVGINTDLDGNPRFVDDTGVPDTGNGTPPIVDMGAYEFQGTTNECCGDGVVEGVEECDDGDFADGDGCSSTCTVENGYTCDVSEPSVCTDDDECSLDTDNCDVNATCTNIPGSFTCTCDPGYSGDGVTCADDNECTLGTDNCDVNATCANTPGSFTCTCNTGYSGDGVICTEVCGDGVIVGSEECDDGAGNSDTAPGACRTDCTNPSCGDGVVDSGEECDDGGTVPGDGCSATCTVEPDNICSGQPSVCGPDCNANSVPDADDIVSLTSPDCDLDGVPDECQIDVNSTAVGGPFFCTVGCDPDCNNTGIPDECEPDCDGNGIPDDCEPDCNTNGIPDECELCVGPNSRSAYSAESLLNMAQMWKSARSAPPGGPVLIGGDDADDHGFVSAGVNQTGWLYIEEGFNLIGPEVGNGNQVAVCLGCNGGQASGGFQSGCDLSNLPGAGWTRQTVTTNANIAAFFAGTNATVNIADAGIVYMPTDFVNVTGGITSGEIDAVNANAVAINTFVSAGGGLFTHSQQFIAGGFGWLQTLLPGLVVNDGITCNDHQLNLTAVGALAFPNLTDAIVSNATPWHGWFSGDLGGLQILVTGPCGANDEPVILGGANVQIQQTIDLTPVTAENPVFTSHTLFAEVSDTTGALLPGVTVTFEVIAGPNLGVTGTDVTDVIGVASFSYVGTGGPGIDEIIATFIDDNQQLKTSNTAFKMWVAPDCLEDCNGNGIPDECDIVDLTNADCNGNGVPDECDTPICGDGCPMAGEACDDGNTSNNDDCLNACTNATCGDGYVWNEGAGTEECDDGNLNDGDACSSACLIVPSPLEPCPNPWEPDPEGGKLNRTGCIEMPPSAVAGSAEVAIRIRLIELYVDSNEDAENGCPVGPDFSAFDNQVRYLGPPSAFDDNDIATTPQFVAAKLQCTPFYRDWNPAALTADLGAGVDTETIYYYGKEVIPCSIYEAQQATQTCVESASEGCFSDALEIRTALWGDIWPPYGDVSFTDIGKMVEAFKGIAFVEGNPPDGAPKKVRAMLRDNEGAPGTKINFTDIGNVVNAFKTIAYAQDGPTACP